ncbi:MAG: prevent-host-death protein [Coriobacteriales bacterium]|jgi:PHD/YefM family antitoxin component YafN of YafNO toxin-antitoxin module|nr:prevent-host-death protein [Coriobacteriales bacterium]
MSVVCEYHRKQLSIIKQVNTQHEPVEILPANGESGVVVIEADFWNSLKETLYLEQTGTLATVNERAKDDSGFTAADQIDWEAL